MLIFNNSFTVYYNFVSFDWNNLTRILIHEVSIQDLSTRAASLRPTSFFTAVFETLISSARSKIWEYFIVLITDSSEKGGYGSFSYGHKAYITLLMSVANSIHEPLKGMIWRNRVLVPFGWMLWPKKTPGERWSWDTTTRSAPLITNVAFSVM